MKRGLGTQGSKFLVTVPKTDIGGAVASPLYLKDEESGGVSWSLSVAPLSRVFFPSSLAARPSLTNPAHRGCIISQGHCRDNYFLSWPFPRAVTAQQMLSLLAFPPVQSATTVPARWGQIHSEISPVGRACAVPPGKDG